MLFFFNKAMEIIMNINGKIFLALLFCFSPLLGMNKFRSFFRAGGQTLSGHIPTFVRSSVEKESVPSINSNFLNSRLFSTSYASHFGFKDFFNFFSSDKYKNFGKEWNAMLNSEKVKNQQNLIQALKEKITKQHSTILTDLTLEQVIEKMKKDNLINQESVGTTLKPLGFSILASQYQSQEEQEHIINLLLKHGANIDQRALLLAVRKLNLGALKILQPHFEPKDLYQFYSEIKENIDHIMHNLNSFDENKSANLEMYKKILEILKQPCKEATYTKGSSIPVDEYTVEQCEETIMTSSCEELYNFLNKNKKKYNSYAHSEYHANHNHTSRVNYDKTNLEDLIDASQYADINEQNLCKFYNNLRSNNRIEDIVGLPYPSPKKDIQDACKKLISHYHPDLFHRDQKLQKIATQVTQKLNEMRK